MRLLERQEIEDIARGSAVLGTGGGGDPYLGKLAAIQAMERFGPLQLAEITELPDDMLVAFPFAIGSPVPFLERITMTKELVTAYHAMCRYMGKTIGAVMSAEIGGMNSVLPFAVGRELGLPVIDGDCMGRAYPEIQLVTLTLYGHSASPLAVADEHGNVTVVDTVDNTWAEKIARPVAVEMGAISGGFGYPVTVRDLKEAAILGTVSFAEEIGRAIRVAQQSHADPVDAVLETTGGFRLFVGRIIDVARKTQKGWALGETRISGVDAFDGREMVVRFQNEHLVAIENDEIVASVPDLIAILDTERGEPITTENLRYGFRVTVIGIPSDAKWRTPEGIALGGPRHFGYDIDFTPVEQRFGGSR
ncbi:MAG: DUF917 domain-containing protein [Thermomicrobiales bacterium]|nr:DUF917 domain-containing protein [Thermomicrobiales bacterium]